MDRAFQALLIASTGGLSWLLFMVVHECGHVVTGWLSGAELARVCLPPLGFSRTDFAANPHPLFVAWGGPLLGVLLPLVLLAMVQITLRHKNNADRCGFLLRWFAGFCLIANGAYLLGGSFLGGGGDDAGVILHDGGARWQLIGFGAATIAGGLCLWNGLGPRFGLGSSRGHVDRLAAVATAVALLAVVAAETLLLHAGK
ncbi:MAG: hypothetical protein ABFC96_13300 [Thermoguttaceae bacterium]